MIWIGIVWNVGLTLWFFLNPHPQFDMKHCVMDTATFTQVCFPKDACWLDADGNAECWRQAKLVKR